MVRPISTAASLPASNSAAASHARAAMKSVTRPQIISDLTS